MWIVLGMGCAGGFRRLRAATFFFRGEKEGKTPPGTAQMSASRSYSPFPGPHYGGHPPEKFSNVSGAQNLSGGSEFPPGHWALSLQNLESLRFKDHAWLRRANALGPVSVVEATLAVTRKPSPF